MVLKTKLTEKERYGLTEEEIKLGTRYLRQNKTRGALNDLDAARLFEMFLLGDSISKIAQQFPQYPVGQIVLTAAMRGWAYDRDKMMSSLQDRVRAKVVKSVLDQVDCLTSMLAVTNAEHLATMTRYIQDPVNNPKPDLRIETIKDYKEVVESLYKIVAGATAGGTKEKPRSPMFDALTPKPSAPKIEKKEAPKELSIIDVQEVNAEEVADGEES